MPKYDFVCTSCGTVFEAFRAFAQGTEGVVCPDDGAETVRLFSPPMDMYVHGGKSSQVDSGPLPTQRSRGGHGHSHAPGTAPHSH